jgi:hypothetical protein
MADYDEEVEVEYVYPSPTDVMEFVEDLLEKIDPVERGRSQLTPTEFDLFNPPQSVYETYHLKNFKKRRTKFYGGTVFEGFYEVVSKALSKGGNAKTYREGTQSLLNKVYENFVPDTNNVTYKDIVDIDRFVMDIGKMISNLEREQAERYVTTNIQNGRSLTAKDTWLVSPSRLDRTFEIYEENSFDDFKKNRLKPTMLERFKDLFPIFSRISSYYDYRYGNIPEIILYELLSKKNPEPKVAVFRSFFNRIHSILNNNIDQQGTYILSVLGGTNIVPQFQRSVQSKLNPVILNNVSSVIGRLNVNNKI